MQAAVVVVLEPIHRAIQAKVVDLVDLLLVVATDHYPLHQQQLLVLLPLEVEEEDLVVEILQQVLVVPELL